MGVFIHSCRCVHSHRRACTLSILRVASTAEPESARRDDGDWVARLHEVAPGCAVTTLEALDATAHGAHCWPCAAVLARWAWARRDEVARAHVLELGAGAHIPLNPAPVFGRKHCTGSASCARATLRRHRTRRPDVRAPWRDGDAHRRGGPAAGAAGPARSGGAERGLGAGARDAQGGGTPLRRDVDSPCRSPPAASQACAAAVLPLTWGTVSSRLLELPPQHIILGADVMYDSRGAQPRAGAPFLPVARLSCVPPACPPRAGRRL